MYCVQSLTPFAPDNSVSAGVVASLTFDRKRTISNCIETFIIWSSPKYWRSKGPWFNPEFRHGTNLAVDFFFHKLSLSDVSSQIIYGRVWQSDSGSFKIDSLYLPSIHHIQGWKRQRNWQLNTLGSWQHVGIRKYLISVYNDVCQSRLLDRHPTKRQNNWDIKIGCQCLWLTMLIPVV